MQDKIVYLYQNGIKNNFQEEKEKRIKKSVFPYCGINKPILLFTDIWKKSFII